MPFTKTQLRAEIDTDPRGLGYAAHVAAGADTPIADLLNEIGRSGETIIRTYVDLPDVVAAIVRAEYDSLGAAGKTYLNEVVLKAQRVKTGDATLRSQLAQLFGAGTATRANLTAIATRSASRAEVLWGEDTYVSIDDIARALRD